MGAAHGNLEAMAQPTGPVRSEQLLEHAAWLRALARALCSDEHAAADLEQETWLAALRGGAQARDARAWLGSVARRLAASVGRSEGRRRAREADVAGSRMPEAPDASETPASVELSARLAQAVAELDEPYRTTLALRYYEGLPPRRIASRLGLDERAVESRLRRGRERLREALDRRRGGREAWFGAAAALALAGSEGGGRGVALAAALLLLGAGVGGGFALHRARGGAVEEPRAEVDLRTPEVLASALESAPREEVAQDARAAVAAPEAGLELVVAGEDTPLAGVHVTWRDARGRREATSDAAGRVRFGSDAGVSELRPVVAATARTRSHQVHVPAAAWTRLEIPRRGGRIAGRVVDLDGRTVPDAEVLAWAGQGGTPDLQRPDRTVRADALGRFALEDMASEHGWLQGWSLAARASGLCSFGTLDGQVDPRTDTSEVVLVVEPSWDVRGRVSDAAGRALAGVPLVHFRGGYEPERGGRSVDGSGWNPGRHSFDLESGADGGFAFQVVADAPDAKVGWRLQANSPRHEMALVDIEGPGWLDVTLEWGARLEGVVLDARLRPVAGAKVALTAHERREPALTDAQGRFAFEGLDELEGALLAVTAEGHALAVAALDLDAANEPQRIVLEPPCRLAGVALDADGKPWPNAMVVFEGDRVIDSAWLPRSRGWRWEDLCVRSDLWCDPQGRFEVGGLCPGRYVVSLRDGATRDFVAYAEIELRPDDPAELELRAGTGLERALTIRGRVVDSTGAPAEVFVIDARRFLDGEQQPEQDVVQRRFEGTGGAFEIRGLRPGRWEFGAFHWDAEGHQGTPASDPRIYGPGIVDLGELRFAESPRR